MNPRRVGQILDGIGQVRVAVYGDLCLDAYWMLDPRGSEISVETGLKAEATSTHRYTPGGAANVVANLAALKPAALQVGGVIGEDIFGRELGRQLQALGADTTGIVTQGEAFDTLTYCKQYLDGKERPRVDFGVFNRRSEATDTALLEALRGSMATADVVVLNQQVPDSIPNLSFIEGVRSLLSEFPERIVLLDSRHYGDRFRNVYRKTNAWETALLNGVQQSPGDNIPPDDLRRYTENLYRESGRAVFVSRGEHGILVCDAHGTHDEAGIRLTGQTDPVGAGDTMLSALAACLAARVEPVEAAQFANLAAAVTVRKLFQTGTACGEEIVAMAEEAGSTAVGS